MSHVTVHDTVFEAKLYYERHISTKSSKHGPVDFRKKNELGAFLESLSGQPVSDKGRVNPIPTNLTLFCWNRVDSK